MILIACPKETKPDNSELKKSEESWKNPTAASKTWSENQRIEREEKALENQKFYFQ
jgi:hypothetical protein